MQIDNALIAKSKLDKATIYQHLKTVYVWQEFVCKLLSVICRILFRNIFQDIDRGFRVMKIKGGTVI